MRTEALSLDQPLGRVGQRIADPLSALPFSNRRRRTFVAISNGRPVGIAEVRIDPANHRWVLTRLAANRQQAFDDAWSRDSIWQRLIVYAIRAAGYAQAKRMHAAFPEASTLVPVLKEIGFSQYARESVLLAQQLPIDGGGITRRQEPSDTWSIHQLYHSVTPRPVQYAEALTSNYWETRAPSTGVTRGYVIEDGYEIIAYCRVVSGGGRHVMNVMVRPDALDLLDTLVADVVDDLAPARGDEVVVSVPDYLQEYVTRLERLGFQTAGRQLRMVKYTVVPQRLQLSSIEELAKSVPKRAVAGTPILQFEYDGDSRSRVSSTSTDCTVKTS